MDKRTLPEQFTPYATEYTSGNDISEIDRKLLLEHLREIHADDEDNIEQYLVNLAIELIKKRDPELEDHVYEVYDELDLYYLGLDAKIMLARKAKRIREIGLVSEHKTPETSPLIPTHRNEEPVPPERLVEEFMLSEQSAGKSTAIDKKRRFEVLQLLLRHMTSGQCISTLGRDGWRGAYYRLQYFPKGVTTDNFSACIEQIEKAYKENSPISPDKQQSKQTLNTAQARLKSLCQYAASNDWIEKDYLIDQSAIRVTRADKKANKYKTLNDQDIEALLNGYLYNPTQSKPTGARKYHSWQFWFLPIALYTGMRRSEIAQLSTGNIKKDEESGIWFIEVDDEESRKVKSDAANRLIPIHQQLIDAGLLDFATEQKKISGYLFPHLWHDAAGNLKEKVDSNKVGKWFLAEKGKSSYFKSCNVTEQGKVLHSTRHTFVTQLRKSGVKDYDMANVVGHEAGLITSHYGEQQVLRDNSEIINTLDYGVPGSLRHLCYNSFKRRFIRNS